MLLENQMLLESLWDVKYGYQSGPLAQSVERCADNAKVVSSILTWTTLSH